MQSCYDAAETLPGDHAVSESLSSLIQAVLNYRQQRQQEACLRLNLSPQELASRFDLRLQTAPLPPEQLRPLLHTLQDYSVNTQSPLFMNQLYGQIHEMGLLGDFLAACLNTSMATWEIAPLLTLIEKEVLRQMAQLIGFDNFDGLLTPGGSFSNLQALLLAREKHFPEARKAGLAKLPPVRIFVSDQAHYSFVKFAQIMGLGQSSVVRVPSHPKGNLDLSALHTALARSKAQGHYPLMLAATAGTTVSGVFDDLEALAALAVSENLWFHVDGSYGGSLLLSPETRHFLKGIEGADSVAWNPHKMLGVPFHCPVLLTRHRGLLEAALSTEADYLFHDPGHDFNLGQKSLHCGRRAEALKFWLSWKVYGQRGLAQRIEKMRAVAIELARQIQQKPDFFLLCEPETPIVCFQYRPEGWEREAINQLNRAVREELFAQGEMLFNYAQISGLTVLRCVISSPDFTPEQGQKILKAVSETAQALT